MQEVEVNSTDVKSQHVKAKAKPLAHVQIIFRTLGFGLIRRENQSNFRKSLGQGEGGEGSKFRQEKAITGLKGIISIN